MSSVRCCHPAERTVCLPGNCNLVYTIIRKRQVFHQLANLPTDHSSIAKALTKRGKKLHTPSPTDHKVRHYGYLGCPYLGVEIKLIVQISLYKFLFLYRHSGLNILRQMLHFIYQYHQYLLTISSDTKNIHISIILCFICTKLTLCFFTNTL